MANRVGRWDHSRDLGRPRLLSLARPLPCCTKGQSSPRWPTWRGRSRAGARSRSSKCGCSAPGSGSTNPSPACSP
eukprot:4609101-Pleurochrysis_carterae.AAC.1